MAGGLCLINGCSGVYLLNHAVACEWNHPGRGCFARLGEVGVHCLGAVVIDKGVLHGLGPGRPWDGREKEAAGGC